MKLSYDYSELISEIKAYLEDMTTMPGDQVQVLRSEKALGDGYKPVVDWYYDDYKMESLLAVDPFDSDVGVFNKKQLRKQYEEKKHQLESMSVVELLNEMQDRNRII